jgi:hypothetical protein
MTDDIGDIFLTDIWGLDINSLRMIIRSSEDYNKFSLVSISSGEITLTSKTGQELYDYLNGNNKFGAKFKHFGRMKDICVEYFGPKGYNLNMATFKIKMRGPIETN